MAKVNVSYPFDDFKSDNEIELLAKEFGGDRVGGGCGFGTRDLEFSFPNKDKAQKAVKKISELLNKRFGSNYEIW